MKITTNRLREIIMEEMTNMSESPLTEAIGVDTKENLDAAVIAAYEEIANTATHAIETGAWEPMEDLHGWIAGEISRMVTEQLEDLPDHGVPDEEISDDETLYISAPPGGHVPYTWKGKK